MARSDVRTWLPLDRWASIIGIHPLHFNQLSSNNKQLVPSTSCGEIFFQESWQNSDRVGRDDIARAIQAAEQEISREVGFNLLPDWTVEERLTYPQPGNPVAFNTYGVNPRGMPKSVELPRGWIISGGVQARSVIQLGGAVVRTDADSDGFAETCTVTVATALTDANEIRAYYPNRGGVDGWEIRPINVVLSGGNAIITFKIWQISAANKMDTLNPQPLDAEQAASYETTVDVYRVYNDPSTQVQFMWENAQWANCCNTCAACQFGTQAGCFHLRDARMGFAVPVPATWDASTSAFTSLEYSACREPDQVRFWYYSGFQDQSLARPKVMMSPYWEFAVAFFAASKIDRPVCGCSNVKEFIDKWRRDAVFTDEDGVGFSLTPEQASNRLGTTVGALYAWREIQRNGVKVSK